MTCIAGQWRDYCGRYDQVRGQHFKDIHYSYIDSSIVCSVLSAVQRSQYEAQLCPGYDCDHRRHFSVQSGVVVFYN